MAQPAANAVGAGRVCIATATSSAAAWAGRPAIRPAMASRQGSTAPATERVTWKRRVRTVGAQRACRMIRPPLDVSRKRTSHRAQAYGSRRSYHRRRTPFSVARRIRRHRLEKQKKKEGLLLYIEQYPAGRSEPGRSGHVHSWRIGANRRSKSGQPLPRFGARREFATGSPGRIRGARIRGHPDLPPSKEDGDPSAATGYGCSGFRPSAFPTVRQRALFRSPDAPQLTRRPLAEYGAPERICLANRVLLGNPECRAETLPAAQPCSCC